MVVKRKVLPDGQPPTVAFAVLAQLCGRKANEMEMGAALFTKNGEGRNFDLFHMVKQILTSCNEEQRVNLVLSS